MTGLGAGNVVLRLSVTGPLKGVSYSLQDKDSTAMVKAAAKSGLVLEGSFAGTDAKGGPTCATVKVEWKVVNK
jgi:hypothetical protein